MNELLQDADVCVKCGLCLPRCPTYQKTQDENESPRGRIALIQAWANGDLHDSHAIRHYVDHCLLCRECERVCPALVPYSRLVDNFRSEFSEQSSSIALSLLKKVAHDKSARNLAKSALTLYQKTQLQAIANYLGLPRLLGLNTFERLLSKTAETDELAEYYLTTSHEQGNVALFVGCMGELLDMSTLLAAIKVLTSLGFNVHIPKQQTCCGALALHSGDKNQAEQLATINKIAFANDEVIISLASGCGAQLQDYLESVIDISQFLMQYQTDLRAKLQPLTKNVYLHTPCSLRNVMRTEQSTLNLLQQIPELTIMPLPKQIICCGSAGSYMLTHSEMAQALLEDVLKSIEHSDAHYLVTSNIGCALHIRAGINERKFKIDVIHPVVLIAQQLS